MKKTVLLIILDGWGCGRDEPGNAVLQARTPQWDKLWAENPHRRIEASAEFVGLPPAQMGNSEVGHLNIGAGRILLQSLLRINKEISVGSFAHRPLLLNTLQKTSRLHILGLLSPGGVHSHQDHIFALCRAAAACGIKDMFIHAFLDGRDTPPVSAAASLRALEDIFAEIGTGRLGSLCGRYYAMDRDKRWQRTEEAYRLLTERRALRRAPDASTALALMAKDGETDEFVRATLIDDDSSIKEEDTVICVNFRADRMKQLSDALVAPRFPHFSRPFVLPKEKMLTMMPYSENSSVPYIYAKESLDDCLGEVLSAHNKTQLRLAETEKFAHVTYFFNGGREEPFIGEERTLVPSLQVATYDMAPQMRAPEITQELIKAVRARSYDFILCNYANGDMVGHTGNLNAAVGAVETLDECLGKILPICAATGSEILLTADHGNCEKMFAMDKPHTAHTMNPVPFLYVGPRSVVFDAAYSAACLADIAPTVLKLMNLSQPTAMTGRALL